MSEIRKATEFTVVRSRWIRGMGGPDVPLDEAPVLRRSGDSHMCCMGFYALACGMTEDQITGVPDLDSIRDADPAITKIENDVVDGDMPKYVKTTNIYWVNDNPRITDDEREAELTRLLGERGVTVTFVD